MRERAAGRIIEMSDDFQEIERTVGDVCHS